MIKSVCGYCGVGCGIEFDEKKLIGDLAYPVNEGLVCAKGVSELKSILTPSRLLRPKLREDIDDEYKNITWDEAIKNIVYRIKATDPKRIGFYLSGQLLTEDYYIANKLVKGFIGTNNVDTNSRTCMASAVVAHKKVFGVDYVPVKMSDLDKTNLIIFAGANPAEAHVVLFNKIKRLKKKGLKVVVIDPRFTESAKYADLYLPIKPGADIDFFNLVAIRLIEDGKVDSDFVTNHCNDYELLAKELKKLPKTKLLKRTGIDKKLFEEFMELFYENENIVSAWTMGLNQSVQGVDKNISLINIHLLSGKICRAGAGPFSLTGQPNAMGGREVGGLSTMLAVHHDFNEESIKLVSDFWKTDKIQPKPGLTAHEILEAGLNKEIDVLIICHTDPVYHLPNRSKIERAIKNIPFVVEINAYENSETSKYAHMQLPASPWGEKEGTQTNFDRTITKQERLTRRSIDCKDDWEIFKLIAHGLGFKQSFDYEVAEDIFEEYKQMCKISKNQHLDIFKADYKSLENKPFVWGEGLFDNKEFFTENKKANLFFVNNKNKSEKTNLLYPFTLLTGRIRDQWHSGTKTDFVDALKKHKPTNFVEINTKDAKNLGINEGDEVLVKSLRGEVKSIALVSDNILEKTLFMPVTNTKINYLTNDLLDPLSKEPDYNQSAVKIEKIEGYEI
ncbi:MAG: molybdopterin oxidoreductase family protein [Sphaerochaetaceae bacterium]|nr:molybdopterin oxidoreductase family protein [Sphaerochaetaceae bacterium]